MNFNFFILGIFLILGFAMLGVWQHELVHTMINEKAGVESELRFALYDGYIPAVGVARLNAPTKEINNYDALHLQNEIVNYNLFAPLVGIMVLLLLGFAHVGERIGGKK